MPKTSQAKLRPVAATGKPRKKRTRKPPPASGRHGPPPTGARQARKEAAAKARRDEEGDEGFKKILHMLRNHCGVDFSLCRASTIQRRLTRRMVLSQHKTLASYAAFLKGNKKELDALYSDVLKRTGRNVRAGRDYAEAILRAAPVPFLILRADLRVNTASESFYQTFQVTPATTEGRLVYEIGNGQWNIPALRKLLEEIIPRQSTFNGFEVTHEFPTIGTRTMLLNARRVERATGMPKRILLAIEDITERKRAQKATARLVAIIESSDDAIISKDLNGIITSWNRGAERLYGYTEKEAIGQPVSMLIPPDRVNEEKSILERICRGESIEHYETVRRRKEGGLLDVSLTVSPIVDEAGKIAGASKIARNITARKAAEAALREGEERFRTMADNIAQLAWMAGAEGGIFWYNQRWFDVTGTTIDEMRGWGWEKVQHPEHLPRVKKKWQRHLKTGEVWEDTFPLRRADGRYRWFLSRAVPIRDGSGNVVRWFGTNTDVTEERAAADALAEAKEQIETASRAKDNFLALLSHELRTPLTPVLMTAAALENDPALPPEVREQLAMMRRNIELEARLIDDLLDITRISRGKLTLVPEIADVHRLLDHASEIVRSDGFGKQVRMVFTLEAARHHVLGDPARLQQVFWNIIKNALKFTPPGGTITIGTRNEADRILVSVEDTGIGIAAKALPRIFNAFEQGDLSTHHRYGGLGLGLAISQAIIEVHGGTLEAESDGPGCGATFTVGLATIDAPAVPAPVSTPRPTPARVLRLLVVEDHEATRDALSRLLTRMGHHVTDAATIREALAAFAAERFDAVISDLGLPDGSGLELMREIQRQRPVPGIALSGYGMEEDVRQTMQAGFFAHLVKPVDLEQLWHLLRQIVVQT